MSRPVYDRIGVGYQRTRQPDVRLNAAIRAGLGDAGTVLDVGAGTGSYEPVGRDVVALDPSGVMLSQHPGKRRVLGAAEALPFPDRAFDASMAVLTIHHWEDLYQGLAELKRVSRRQVVFTWDPDFEHELWVVEEYVPEIGVLERSRHAPIAELVEVLGAHTVQHFEIPHDFSDGFQAAYWRRPESYLDPEIRNGSSTFSTMSDEIVEPAMERLRLDLVSGAWERRHRELLSARAIDFGYRLIVSG